MKLPSIIFLACCLGVFSSCERREKREAKYPNGQIQEQFSVVETENGSFVKDGEYKTWHINGQLQSAGLYKNGKKEGDWSEWHENGQKASEETYAEGVREGAMKFLDSKGKLCGLRTFRKGVDISLPAVYKAKGGDKLELSPDGTYKYSNKFAIFVETMAGEFEVSSGIINLRGMAKLNLIKYTEDTVEFSHPKFKNSTILLVRQAAQQNAK